MARIAMAQMKMCSCIEKNLEKTISFMEQAKKQGADLIFFPELQLSPFFPQFEKGDASKWLLEEDHPAIRELCGECRRLQIYASPNVYLKQGEYGYDASFMIAPDGSIAGISKMVHIAQAKQFYEKDYYTPSDTGFRVYDTAFGKVGIVICFDRHLPESIRTCAMKGADLILIPTANTAAEPMELFEWEIRVQAMQNRVFAAMCNRVGQEAEMLFAGESLIAGPDGGLIAKADRTEQLVIADVDFRQRESARNSCDYLNLLRPEFYT